MILVVLGISILLLIGGIVWGIHDDWYEFGSMFFTAFGIVALIGALISTIVLSVDVSKLAVIDEKIEMYQVENEKIEEQIKTVVQQYQKYERGTFKELAPQEAVTMVSLYPELKSDELVSKQIAVYVNNNEKIKELKEDKITARVYRWWLYFGK